MIELVSIHIPKTAGRSFKAILDSIYDNTKLANFDLKNYPDKSVPPVEQFLSQLDDTINVIHGHFQFNEINTLKNINNVKIVTWLRDPVERVISNYCFFKKRISLALNNPDLQKRKNESLLEYASLDGSRNRMHRFLDGLNLNNIFFIGITESFETDLNFLAKKLNWGPIEIPRINDNSEFKSGLPAVTQQEKKIIFDLNQIDIELYRKALEMRNKRIF
jgi:hypothetical protein